MKDERLDLTPLDPQQDARFERMVTAISERARFELARRAAQRQSVVELMAGWARPALLAAASIAAVSLALLAAVEHSSAEPATGGYMTVSEVPAAASGWYEENREPTVEDLLVASAEGGR
jgi:hypothetical protein